MAAIAGVSVVFAVKSISERSIGHASSYVGGKSFYISILGHTVIYSNDQSDNFRTV